MARPAGQGESCDTGPASRTAPLYCSVCGRPADAALQRGPEAFCSPGHAEEFAREVAAARAPGEAGR
jgi:hypothetical protein